MTPQNFARTAWTPRPVEPRSDTFAIIKDECSQFLQESKGVPLFKSHTGTTLSTITKVKARHKRSNDPTLTKLYDTAFTPKLRERAIFCQTIRTTAPDAQCCYVFPINGYKYMYSPEVESSTEEYKIILNTMMESFPSDKAFSLMTDVLKFTYVNNGVFNLQGKNVEVIVYNIPYYYLVPASIPYMEIIS